MYRVSVPVLTICHLFFAIHAALAQASGELPPAAHAGRGAVEDTLNDELFLKGQSAAGANASTVTIMTNRTLGGSLMMSAIDLSTVLDDGEFFEKMRVIPLVGRGKIQNLWDVFYMDGVDLGFIQSDIFEYLKADPRINYVRQNLRYLTVMFPEEIHVLARSDIRTLQDLAGKKVSVNVKGTAAAVTGPALLKRLGVRADLVNVETNIAIERLKQGELAAHFAVVGKPAQPVAHIGETGLHLLPIPYTRDLFDLYLPSRFTAEDYPHLIPPGEEVETIAVGNLLALFNWPEKSERYAKIARFTEAFFSKFRELHKPGFEPRWKEVNLAAEMPGWTRFKPAQDWLDRLKGN